MLKLPEKILNFLLPFTCVSCHTRSDRQQDLCQKCFLQLPYYQNGCISCGNLLTEKNLRCGQCLTNPPIVTNTHILFHYQPPITQWIIQLKFYRKLLYARLLGELFAHYLQTQYTQFPNLIIPIPLHLKRIKERGHNQVIEIARPIAKIMQLPILLKSAKRNKYTAPQTTLSRTERQQNMQNAFIFSEDLTGQHVAILDDVMTTGSTLNAFCQTIAAHRPKQIDIWCCARGHFHTNNL